MLLLLEVFCLSVCGRCCDGSRLVGKKSSVNGDGLTRSFFYLVVRRCQKRGSITFCTSGLYVASGCLSVIVGRTDKGATGS